MSHKLPALPFFCALILSLLGATVFASPAHESLQAQYTQGNRLHEAGQYTEAIEAYQFVLSQAPNGYVYYNLGNAYFQQGKRGWAIWCYERALHFLPRDQDVQTNLAYANSLNEDRFEYAAHPLSLAHIYRRLTLNGWLRLCATGYVLTAIVAILFLLLDRLRRWLLRLGILSLVGLAVCLLCLGLGQRDASQRYTIITEVQAPVTRGPGQQFESLFTLHEGAKLEILQQRQDWLEVNTPDGRRGWLPQTAAAEI